VTTVVIAVLLGASYSGFNHLLRPGRDIDVEAGKWLATQSDLKSSRLVLTDANVEFYRDVYSSDGDADTMLVVPVNGDTGACAFEGVAERERADIVVVKVRGDEEDADCNSGHFEKVREFNGKNESVVVYRRVSCRSGWPSVIR